MSDWAKRAEISSDVVYFQYTQEENIKQTEEIFVWDLDKTYLDTKFETFKGLLRTIFEKAFQKRNVPGTAVLVRALIDSWRRRFPNKDFPIFFITASPPQMEKKIIQKLRLDGLNPFGLFCKDNLQNMRPGRLWRINHQIGYKLHALLQLRLHLGGDVRMVMWGDDSESDVLVYCLFSDLCMRRMSSEETSKTLKALRVAGSQLEAILELQSAIPVHDPVEKIYINLAEDTDSEYYLKFGRRVLATYSSLQTSLDLFQDKRISIDNVISVAKDLVSNFAYTPDELEKGLDDLVRRSRLAEPTLDLILPALQAAGLVSEYYKPSVAPKAITALVGDRVVGIEGTFEPWVPERIDYLHDYR